MKLKNTRSPFIRLFVLILCLALSLSALEGCSGAPAGSQTTGGSIDGPEVWAENANARKAELITNAFRPSAFDERYLKWISAHAGGNYMTSPLSFRYALGLLLAGAEGETKTELLSALGVSSEKEWIDYCLDVNGFVNYFSEDLRREKAEFEVQKKEGWVSPDAKAPFRALNVANSVWKAEWVREPFKADYQDSVVKNYAAEYRTFTPENAVEKINQWASIKTEKMIERFLPNDYPTDMLAIVLMNALYFKDGWQTPFNPSLTETGDFLTALGGRTEKEFMFSESTYAYFEDSDTQLVILPMEGGVSMAFVLGSTEDLSDKISNATAATVRVTIPKIDLDTDFSSGELTNFLKEHGVQRAFSNADFSRMIDHDVYVSDIIQKTRIKLDENGVEAAAVTAIMENETACFVPEEEPKEFTADQPFSFYIYTTVNDATAVLFAGEIME